MNITTPITDSTIKRIEAAHTKAGAHVTTTYKAAFVALGHEMRALEFGLQTAVSNLGLLNTVIQWVIIHHNEDPESCLEKLRNVINFTTNEQ